jgi:hypothetical protein
MDMKTLIIIAALGSTAVTCVHADVYKWIDQQGQVHFEDQPGANSEKLELAPALESEAGPALGLRPGERALLQRIEDREQRRFDHGSAHNADQRAARTDADYDASMCMYYQRRIEDIEAELRSGYKASRGEWLETRLSRYGHDAKKYCR